MPPGRPRKNVDRTRVIELASKGLVMSEIAALCDICEDTLRVNYLDAVKRGRELCNSSLRRKQVELALDGNPTMLVWLGKNLLGQSDKVETKITEEISFDGLSVPEQAAKSALVNQPN